MTDRADDRAPGVGCRTIAVALAVLAVFAVVSVSVGLYLVLGAGCSGACERLGFTLYAAGAPVSGLFAAVAGELPLAWMTDLGLWIVVSVGAARLVERRRLRAGRVTASIIGIALVYGAAVGSFLERI